MGLLYSEKTKKSISKLNYWTLLLFVFWLPLKDNYFPLIITLWIFTWLLEGNIKTKFSSFPYRKLLPGFAVYFVLTVLALLQTTNINHGIFLVQEKLSLIFFPIILAGSNKQIRNNYKTILLVFVLGNLIAAFYGIINTFINSLVFENGTWYLKYWVWDEYANFSFWKLINIRANTFSYSHVSAFKHPAYFAMYLTFSISILVYLYKQKFAKTISQKILIIATMVFFAFMIYLLQSNAGFAAFGLATIFTILYEFKTKQKKRYLFTGSIFLLISIIVVLFSKPAQKRIKDYTEIMLNPTTSGLTQKDDRIGIWYSTTQVIKENFWFGTAPANLTTELEKKYTEYGFIKAEKEHLNAHNQYLESFAGLGILGFLSLLYILGYGFVYAYKNKHYLLFFLLLILSINFMFESMLNRMAGVLFMMFFYSLFFFMKPAKNKLQD